MRRSVLFGLAGLLLASTAFAQSSNAYASLVSRFDAQIDPHELDGWMKLMAAEPNQVGSPHDKSNADWILKQFKSWGWDTKVETFQALFPTPIAEAVALGGL